jgi:hypothetical protein
MGGGGGCICIVMAEHQEPVHEHSAPELLQCLVSLAIATLTSQDFQQPGRLPSCHVSHVLTWSCCALL